jgi:microcystin degradation protein MlrC
MRRSTGKESVPSKQRIVAVMFKHETNTFAPFPTPWEAFGANGPVAGEEAIGATRGTNQALAAFLDFASETNADLIVPLCGRATPGGIVDRVAFERAWDWIRRSLDRAPDAVLLDLHGAMVVEGIPEADAELTRRIRVGVPSARIGVALDLHANISPVLLENADVVAGYKTYPHVDMYDNGAKVADLLFNPARMDRGRLRAAYVPLLAHTLRMNTSKEPMATLIEMAENAERSGRVEIASLFGGFYSSDVPRAGLSVVAFGKEAQQVCDEIARAAWQKRDAFYYAPIPLGDSIAAAARTKGRPIILLDHCDNATSGATQDSMDVVREALEQGLSGIIAGPVCDPEAVAHLAQRGVGAEVTLPIGGKLSVPAVGLEARPLILSGTVKAIANGRYVIDGPMFTGVTVDMGKCVRFSNDQVDLVLTERRCEPFDLNTFRVAGLEPAQARYIVLKSKMHFRSVYEPISAAIVECDGSGVGTSDFSKLVHAHVRRPIYPLDRDFLPAEPWMAG